MCFVAIIALGQKVTYSLESVIRLTRERKKYTP
jgi:hypothetical protein